MQISKITSKKVLLPALLLTSSVVVTNVINQNNTDDKQNIEYMSNNPSTLATEAGLLSLFGLGRKRKDKSDEASELKKEENKIPKYSGTLPEDTQLQMTEFGYPQIDKNAEYAIKEDFEIPKGSTITYPDGTTKDLATIFEDDGVNLNSPHTSRVFVKDKNGNIFSKYYKSNYDKDYSFFDIAKNEDKYYAISDDGELYSIDFTKLPEEKEFIFNVQPISKEIVIPKGAVIKYNDKTLLADEKADYCSLHFFKDYNGENHFCTFSISRPEIKDRVIDKSSLQKQEKMYEQLIEGEKSYITELNKQNKTDDRPRNMVVSTSRSQYEYCSPSVEEAVTDNELNFYKQVYDYYTNTNKEYNNYKFVFQRRNSEFELKILDGENVIQKYTGIRSSKVDSPIFHNTRIKYTLGDFEATYPLF